MKGKICLITGASGGIGYFTALKLAQLGATIIIASKNEQRGNEAKQMLIEGSNNPNVEYMQVDLASFLSIRAFADNFISTYKSLDVLVNNAGVYFSKQAFTEDKIEIQFAINHLAPFMITGLLIEPLRAAGTSRIVNLSSRFHFYGKIYFDNLFLDKIYNGLRAYCQSKLGVVLFTYKLAEMLGDNGVSVNCLHPGTARTSIGNTNSTGLYPIICNIIKPVLVSPNKAARTTILLASSEEVNGVSGKYFEKRKAVRSSKASYNREDADRLWTICEELTGIKYQ